MPGWAKVKNAARYGGVSERSFRNWLKQGLRHVRMDTGTILIKYSWVDEYLTGFETVENDVDRIVCEVEKELQQ